MHHTKIKICKFLSYMDVEKVDRLGNVDYESYSFCKDYSTWIYNLVSHNDYINDYSYKAS